ncbi:MAG TPA: GAF domain-containing protein [Candidatus Dormibacteraeota bacterium]|nr:GAF domain-containing protein [Candidatus Dormibacteraeota bacterium]
MGQLPDLQQARRRLGLALSALAHDRWVVGYLRGGCLRPIAASEISRRLLLAQELRPLSRRALYEQKPIVVNTVVEAEEGRSEYDWELDWPCMLYTPIGESGQRPIGLLIVGCRRDHWYSDEDVAYAHALGRSLAPMVAALRRPLGRLNEEETAVAHLLGHGFSSDEIARAMGTDARRAQTMVDSVTRKLQTVSSQDLAFPAMQLKRMTW